MKVIHKYQIDEIMNSIPLDMPQGAKILSFQLQYEVPCIWALVDTDATMETRHFRIFGTGHPFTIDPEEADFIGTVQLSGGTMLVHLFEERK